MTCEEADLEENIYSVLFSALKHPIRRSILSMVQEKPQRYTDLLNALEIEKGLLNYHLSQLEGLITKDESDRYVLTSFGEKTYQIVRNINEPVGEISGTVGILRLRVPRGIRYTLIILGVLLLANVYVLNLYNEKTSVVESVTDNQLNEINVNSVKINEILKTIANRSAISEANLKELMLLNENCVASSGILSITRGQDNGWAMLRRSLEEVTDLLKAIDNAAYGFKSFKPDIYLDAGQVAELNNIQKDYEGINDAISSNNYDQLYSQSSRLLGDIQKARDGFNHFAFNGSDYEWVNSFTIVQ